MTETDLEQVGSNREFRQLAEHFGNTTYLHLVPQLLQRADEIAARIPESDPFGQGLMQRIAQTPRRTRDARLKRIQKALVNAVPMFSALRFEQDPITGLRHLEANFSHWRANGAWQREDQLSDGTLRLIGLLWALQEGDHLLLLEEPELSLNEAIFSQIPLLIDRILRDRKKGRSAGHRDEMLAQTDPTKRGSGYHLHLTQFVLTEWDGTRAQDRSESLGRAIRRLEQLAALRPR